MEDRLAGMMNTDFLIPGHAWVICSLASPSSTSCTRRNFQRRVVRVRLFRRLGGRSWRRESWSGSWSWSPSCLRRGFLFRKDLFCPSVCSFLRLSLVWRIVDGRVLSFGAWRDFQKLIERQHAGFATPPSYKKSISTEFFPAQTENTDSIPFCPSWKIGGPG